MRTPFRTFAFDASVNRRSDLLLFGGGMVGVIIDLCDEEHGYSVVFFSTMVDGTKDSFLDGGVLPIALRDDEDKVSPA